MPTVLPDRGLSMSGSLLRLKTDNVNNGSPTA